MKGAGSSSQFVASGEAVIADVESNKVEWQGHDWVACAVKAVKAFYLCVTAYMMSTADARCPENMSKLRQISNLLLKQRREHGA